MIVADSNLIASCVIRSTATEAALALKSRDGDWYVPRLWRYEVQNIFATMIKAGLMAEPVAKSVYRSLRLALANREREPKPDAVFEIVGRYGLTAYDAQFVALADELGCPLYTQDKEVLKARPDLARRFYIR